MFVEGQLAVRTSLAIGVVLNKGRLRDPAVLLDRASEFEEAVVSRQHAEVDLGRLLGARVRPLERLDDVEPASLEIEAASRWYACDLISGS